MPSIDDIINRLREIGVEHKEIKATKHHLSNDNWATYYVLWGLKNKRLDEPCLSEELKRIIKNLKLEITLQELKDS